MSVYIVTGNFGSGKTLVSVSRMVDTLKAGRRVATNIDLDLSACLGVKQDTKLLTRLPDKPSADDMQALGEGQSGDYDESKFGLIVLDELGAWLNSRTWSDKTRMAFINWCIHARHLRWAIIFIVQDAKMIDAQVRDALGEHLVVCKRTDRIPLPLVGKVTPKVHVGSVYYGMTESKDKRIERWYYRGKHLYAAYKTDQIFSEFTSDGLHCVISKNYWSPEQNDEINAQSEKAKNIKYATAGVAALGLMSASVYAMVSPPSPNEAQASTTNSEEVPTQTTVKHSEFMIGSTYQGSFVTNNTELHFFKSARRGAYDSKWIYAMGGIVNKVSDCVVMVVWRDNTTSMVTCHQSQGQPETPPKDDSFLGLGL